MLENVIIFDNIPMQFFPVNKKYINIPHKAKCCELFFSLCIIEREVHPDIKLVLVKAEKQEKQISESLSNIEQ